MRLLLLASLVLAALCVRSQAVDCVDEGAACDDGIAATTGDQHLLRAHARPSPLPPLGAPLLSAARAGRCGH